MISNIIRWIHYLIVLFLFFGFLLPEKYLWTYILFVIVLKIHWMKNNDKCILTEVEQYFNNKTNNNNEMKTDTRYPFMSSMLSNVNISMTDEQYDFIFNVVIVITVFYSTCKYKKYLSNVKK